MKQIHCVLCSLSGSTNIANQTDHGLYEYANFWKEDNIIPRAEKKVRFVEKTRQRMFSPLQARNCSSDPNSTNKTTHTHTKQSESFRKKHQQQLRHNRPKKCHERPFCSPAFPSQPVRLNEVSGMYTRVRTQNIPRGNGRKR